MVEKKTFKINLNVYVICKLIHDGVCVHASGADRNDREGESNRARTPEESKVNNTLLYERRELCLTGK